MISLIQQSRPSYGEGFARGKGDSANPSRWEGLIGAWIPSLGVSGVSVQNYALRKASCDLTGTIWSPSTEGHVIDFTASTDKGVVASPFLNGYIHGAPISILCLLYPRTLAQTGTASRIIQIRNSAGKTAGFGFDNSNVLGLFIETSANQVTGKTNTSAFNLNEWSSFAVTYTGSLDADEIHLYVNAVRMALGTNNDSASAHSGNPITTTTIGAHFSNNNRTMDGLFAVMLIYNRVVSESEIMDFYIDPLGFVRSIQFILTAPIVGGRIMSSLANYGGLAGYGGIAGKGGGLAG